MQVNAKKNLLYAPLYLLIAGALCCLVWRHFPASMHELSDHAANSLLVIDAKSLNLWVGNYSRIGFNHPGPAILYVLAAGEVVFYDWLHVVASPFFGQVLAVVFYNVFWIFGIFAINIRMLRSFSNAFLVTLTFLFLTLWFDYHFFLGLWFPQLYYFPFAVVLFALARLSAGKIDALVFLAVASGFLVNGHVSFIPILGIMLVAVLVGNYILFRKNMEYRIISKHFLNINRTPILVSIGILSLFFVPLGVMTITNFPGPVASYVQFSGRGANTLREAFNFVAVYWGGTIAMLIGLMTYVVLYVMSTKNSAQGLAISGFMMAALAATLGLLFYAKYGIDQLYASYIGLFYYAVPVLLVAVIVDVIAQRVGKNLRLLGLLLCGFLLVGIVYQLNNMPGSLSHDGAEVELIYNKLSREQSDGRLVLDLDASEDWGLVWTTIVGVELYAKRMGRDLFCIRSNWDILFTPQAQCNNDELTKARRFFVTKSEGNEHSAGYYFDVGGLRFHEEEGPDILNKKLSIAENQRLFQSDLLGDGWSGIENTIVWSVGKEATIKLGTVLGDIKDAVVILDVGALLPKRDPVQRVKFYFEGSTPVLASFSPEDNQKLVTVPLPKEHQNLELKIQIESPVSPKREGDSQDDRELGVALHGLEVRANRPNI